MHSGATEDGSCTPDKGSCDWYTSLDGGYHYSLFALTKGLGGYIPSDLSDPTNWYAKVVDLLLSQQNADGSWPPDGRDDFDTVFATGLAVSSLGLVAVDAQITGKSETVTATEGTSFNGKVATFSDPDMGALEGEYSASIDWGDGHTSTGTVSGSNGWFSVSGSHTYNDEVVGSDTITVTITDTDNSANSATVTDTATVNDANLTAGSISSPGSVSSQSVSLNAGFTDDNSTTSSTADFTATIDWGDGHTSTGTVGGSGGSYSVTGPHTYAGTGYYTINVDVTDDGGSTVDEHKTVLIYGTAKGGSFVIGSNNTAVNTSVYFWGSQWAKNNPLTASAPGAFKGFEDQPPLPDCGQTWTTDPGNSTPPPSGPLPAYMAVIVSSSISKSGSTITGNTPHLVVVRTNPGYQPDPGHPGTGTVVAQIC